MTTTLGILLAGGRGERFGSPKALASFRGRSLLDRARAELAAACDQVVVVMPEGGGPPVDERERVADAIAGAGPLSALVAGLESRLFARAMVLAVDLPLFDRAHVSRLLGSLGDDIAVVPAPGGRAQPLAAVYSARATAPLRAALDAGHRALVAAVLALSPTLLDDARLAALGISPEALEDADTPADLARLEALPS
ncbi:MAG: molybdenum cofactor guanylyltransferase [Candidatus Eisenbacteria bacterium]